MSKPEPPTPPNPYATAGAATSTNIGTAIANSFLNNTNQETPEGSLNYGQTGSYAYTDPVSGQVYQIPQFTATQTLNPQNQAIKGQTDATKYNLAGMANAQSQKIAGILGTNVDISQAPSAGDPNSLNVGLPANFYSTGGPIQTSLGDYGQQQSTFGDAGDITRSYGPDDNFSADRQRVEEATFGRINPQLERDRANLEQRLQDQGIRYGSQAYASAMDDYNRQSTDARFAAIQNAGQEQQRMNSMAAQLAAFQNAAQGQAYAQEKGRGDFANEAQKETYQQALGAGAFGNQAQQQQVTQNAGQAQFYNQALAQQQALAQSQFNASQAARNQYMQEQYAYRNQPINEISALMSGSQVQNPNWLNTPSSQIPTTDIAGIINTGYNQQMQSYQQQSANYNNLIGGILGLGAGAIKGYSSTLSDEREKENITRIGTVLATRGVGDVDHDEPMGSIIGKVEPLPIYQYSYKKDPASTRHVGPMAQDVEKVDPRAVRNIGGRKYVDTHTMGNILKAAA